VKVPYTNFKEKDKTIRPLLVKAFEGVVDSGQYIQGSELRAFEKEFASYCGSKFAAGTANGTCALHLILRAIGVGEGDEVITAPNSFIASAASIALVGATPVFADVQDDFNIDPRQIEAAISPRTRAILPVHLTGRPCRMREIMSIAARHGLFVLEDAAQAVGARLDGKGVGSWGHAAGFSLHPLKNLHAYGDAGIITTDDYKLIEILNKSKNHGLASRTQCDFWGHNCRLDEVQAALLRVQLTVLDAWTTERRRLALRYNALLSRYVTVPTEASNEHHVFQTYVIVARERDALQEYLRENGVEAIIHYPVPIHMQPAASKLGYSSDDFPKTKYLSDHILSLPLYPSLTSAQQDYVASVIESFYRFR